MGGGEAAGGAHTLAPSALLWVTLSGRPASWPHGNTGPWHYLQKSPRVLTENEMRLLQLK